MDFASPFVVQSRRNKDLVTKSLCIAQKILVQNHAIMIYTISEICKYLNNCFLLLITIIDYLIASNISLSLRNKMFGCLNEQAEITPLT